MVDFRQDLAEMPAPGAGKSAGKAEISASFPDPVLKRRC